MQRTTTLPRRRKASFLLAGVASFLLAASLGASPALAHDGLIDTEPSNGAKLSQSMKSATLTFSGELNSLGAEVRMTNGKGTAIDAVASVKADTLTVDFGEELPDGEYTLTWRVVSSDGHPIEGTSANGEALEFVVAPGAGESASPSGDPTASAAASSPAAAASAADPTPSTQAAQARTEQTENDSVVPIGVWILAAVVLAAIALVIVRIRRKRR